MHHALVRGTIHIHSVGLHVVLVPPQPEAALLKVMREDGEELEGWAQASAHLAKVLDLQHSALLGVQLHHLVWR